METKKKKSNTMTYLIVLLMFVVGIYAITKDNSGTNRIAFQWDATEKVQVFQVDELDSTYINNLKKYIIDASDSKNHYFIVVKENKDYENFSFPFNHATHEKFKANLLNDDNVIMTGIKFVNGFKEIAYKQGDELTVKPM